MSCCPCRCLLCPLSSSLFLRLASVTSRLSPRWPCSAHQTPSSLPCSQASLDPNLIFLTGKAVTTAPHAPRSEGRMEPSHSAPHRLLQPSWGGHGAPRCFFRVHHLQTHSQRALGVIQVLTHSIPSTFHRGAGKSSPWEGGAGAASPSTRFPCVLFKPLPL